MLKSHKKGCEFNPVNLPEFLKNDDSPLLSGKSDWDFPV